MAKREELRLDVEVKGARDVDKLAESLEDVESASQQARKALVQMAQTSDAEMRSAAQAAEALGRALGPELTAKMDLDQVVVDLNRMGVSFDEIRLEAEQFATTLRQVDDINLRQTTDGLDNMRTKLDGVRNNADQSRSVLANMAGNSAQDLGELGGVAGTAGVAIGQLAEYATEGNISLSSLAKVAGPMAGLAAATILASNAMKFFQQDSKRSAEAVEAMNEALINGEDPLEAYTELLKEQGGILAGQRDQGVKELITDVIGLTDATEDLTPALINAGVTIVTWNKALEGGDAARKAFVDGLTQVRKEGHITQSEWYSIVNAFGDAAASYDKSLKQTADASKFFVTTQEDINGVLAGLADPLTKHTELWNILINDVADGTFDFENAADAVLMLADATGLEVDQVVELVKQKADEHLEDVAAAAEEAEEKARDLAQAVADLGDVIAEVDTDDLSNIGSALAEGLDVGGIAVNLQVEEAQVRGQIAETSKEIQDFVDEHGEINWSVVLDPTKTAAGFDPVLAGMVGDLQDQLQTGIVNAFQSGGVDAATQFAGEFRNQLIEMGLSPAQVTEFMGIPPGGNIPLFLQLMIDQEAKADALAILDSLMGIDPDNPILAYMRLAVQTGEVEPQIAEIAAKILAGQALGVPAKLEEFSQADIDAAFALVAAYGVTVPVAVDDGGTVDQFAEDADAATEDRTTHVIVPKSDSLGQMQDLIDHVARARTVNFNAKADNAGTIDGILDAVAADRNSDIWVRLPNYNSTDRELEQLARDRHSTVHVHMVTNPTGEPLSANPTTAFNQLAAEATPAAGPMAMATAGVAPLAAPTIAPMSISPVTMTPVAAAAPVINNFSVAVSAGVIGNRHETERVIAKALRNYTRLNGRRN